ncbi:hypothetical protein OS493_016294 [Desmophyllum pertusum]|uniref:Uncharacterized protein n=1 Tax=Desmophyllum pertusum TaxID=174260 RepID=A0A9X0D2W4_9CNID|nr:hypothetical protein OS493_016294 [Desmophyllum pertusum]
MMKLQLATVLLGLFLFSTAVDGIRTKESITLRVANYAKYMIAQMTKILKNANLTENGFQKEETRIMPSTDNATSHSAAYKTIYYYKVVDCSRVMQVMKELDKLLPELSGASVDARLAKEMKDKKIDTMRRCKAGMEFHLEPDHSHVPRSMFGLSKGSAGCCCCCCKVKVEDVPAH